ncbi:MAG: polysaccharide deacetylase family protein [Kofleriaceae bacterium]|nr:polysaccharide deacetylase family protein [Kofleriaceae bacterium]MBP9203984.1 polysaccharide deacetylase family protein [Kofleriaceae bacterium]
MPGRPAPLSRLKTRVLGALPGVVTRVRASRAGPPRVALTFDDGPDDLTPAYLELLDRHEVPATFFIMGDLSSARPDLVRAYRAGGHQVASHGYDHTRFPALSAAELDRQLVMTEAAIGGQGTGTPWVRPPYGAVSPRVLAHLARRGYVTALWSVDAMDYAATDPTAVVARCRPDRVVAGDVILLHEHQPATLAALPAIIDNLRAAGFELVTMADLVEA